MSFREWAIKPGELKPLGREGLLLFAVRCALRVEPWAPASARDLWADDVAFATRAAFGARLEASEVDPRVRELSDAGAMVCNRLAATDEPLGRCANYATQTLAAALEAAREVERPKLVRAVVNTAKFSASIAAIWAHAGRVPAERGADAVELACSETWAAIQADVAVAAAGVERVRDANDGDAVRAVRAVRELAPLWPGEPPSWSRP